MSNVPNPPNDLVERAEEALRAFEGQPLNRELAGRLLSMWHRNGELSQAQRIEVLRRFPRLKTHAWWPRTDAEGGCHVWTCTCGEIVLQAFGSAVPNELISHPQEHGQMRGAS